jgi:hypothetical protein
MREETSIEIQHSQQTPLLADRLRRGTGLEICDTVWKGLRAYGGDFVSEE